MKIIGLSISDEYTLSLTGNYSLFMEFLDRNIDQPRIPFLEKRRKNKAPATMFKFYGIIKDNMFEIVYHVGYSRIYSHARITGHVTSREEEITIEVIQKLNIPWIPYIIPIIALGLFPIFNIGPNIYIGITIFAVMLIILALTLWVYCYLDMYNSKAAFIKEMKTLARLSQKEYDT